MPAFPLISDDPGTVLDSLDDVARAMPAQAGAASPADPVISAPQSSKRGPQMERLYQSPCRFAAPRLMICDYSSLDDGEVVYLRGTRTIIGRTVGDVVLPLDTLMSGEHAEIIRQDAGGALSWILHDLDSSNGTLVRCKAITLQTGAVLQIGSRRYRFEGPAGMPHRPDEKENVDTALADDVALLASTAFPSLVDCSAGTTGDAKRLIIRAVRATVGRPGFGNDIELDDPCVAQVHATIECDVSGTWHLRAMATLNGVWVKIRGVRLTNGCLFQCGEQRFKFHLPR